jgi:hypothetical protein
LDYLAITSPDPADDQLSRAELQRVVEGEMGCALPSQFAEVIRGLN